MGGGELDWLLFMLFELGNSVGQVAEVLPRKNKTSGQLKCSNAEAHLSRLHFHAWNLVAVVTDIERRKDTDFAPSNNQHSRGSVLLIVSS